MAMLFGLTIICLMKKHLFNFQQGQRDHIHTRAQKEHALLFIYNYFPMRENLFFSQSLLLPQDKKNKHS